MSVHITLVCAIASSLLVWWSYRSLFVSLRRGKKQPVVTRLALCWASTLGFGSAAFGGHAWGDLACGGINAALSARAVWLTWKSHESIRVSPIDGTCLALSTIGTAAFLCVRDPAVGAAFAISGDLIAFLPVIPEICLRPHTQPVRTYFIGSSAAAVALTADWLQGPIGAGSAFTVWLLCIDTLLPTATLIMCVVHRQKARKTSTQIAPKEAFQNL